MEKGQLWFDAFTTRNQNLKSQLNMGIYQFATHKETAGLIAIHG